MSATSQNIPKATALNARAQAIIDAAAIKQDEQLAVKYKTQFTQISNAAEQGLFTVDVSFVSTENGGDNGVELMELLTRYQYVSTYKSGNIALGLITVTWSS